jgi:hypothetical protein
MIRFTLGVLLAAAVFSGCKTSYVWTGTVPADRRTVSVPVFRNESDVTELGSVVSRQILREFQREGTFRLSTPDAAAVEVQGIIRQAESRYEGGARQIGNRFNNSRFKMVALVSVVDRVNGKVLIDNRPYTAETVFASSQDLMTGRLNASGRLAEELARQVVDDVLAYPW